MAECPECAAELDLAADVEVVASQCLDHLAEARDAANWGRKAPSLLPRDPVVSG